MVYAKQSSIMSTGEGSISSHILLPEVQAALFCRIYSILSYDKPLYSSDWILMRLFRIFLYQTLESTIRWNLLDFYTALLVSWPKEELYKLYVTCTCLYHCVVFMSYGWMLHMVHFFKEFIWEIICYTYNVTSLCEYFHKEVCFIAILWLFFFSLFLENTDRLCFYLFRKSATLEYQAHLITCCK